MPNTTHTPGIQHLWLPYCQMKTAAAPLDVVGTKGSKIQLADGRELVDGIASWWTACHGYNHPHILAAMQHQLNQMPHVMFGGLVHEPAKKLANMLCSVAPSGLERVFFSDSGSTAVEVAIKMALQYWKNKGSHSKTKIIGFRNGYHGDTIGAMSVADPDDMHKAFRSMLGRQYILDIPNDEYSLSEFTEVLAGIASQTAALIIEPLVQGAGGMRFHSPDILAEIHRLCNSHDILLIADEVATGFGRTGSMFACHEAGITPDIMCVGKALTGGVIGMAATLATANVFDAFYDDNHEKAFMHGPTYMANPLACSAAIASLELFATENRLQQVEAIEAQLSHELRPCRGMPFVVDVRVKGAIGVVQLDAERMNKQWFRDAFLTAGVWVRPLKDVVYLTPALTIQPPELTQLTSAVTHAVGEWSKS